MKLRAISLLFTVALFFAPLAAFAREDEEAQLREARLEGFPGSVALEKSTAVGWLFFFFLAACAMAVLFKNARRTHLD